MTLNIKELKEWLEESSEDGRRCDAIRELIAIREQQGKPVAYLYVGDAMECKHVMLAEDTDEGQAENCTPLFAAPQKPVVPVGFLFVVKATGAVIYSIAASDIEGAQLVGPIYGDLTIEAAGGIVKDGE